MINKDFDICVGIDLGTTNSVLATVNKKLNGDLKSAIVDIARAKDIYGDKMRFTPVREHTLPSVIYYREEDNYKPLVGDFAKRQHSMRPHLVAKSIKSQMSNHKVEGLSEAIPDKTPAQVASRILQHMLYDFGKQYKLKNIKDAVITVPANFNALMCKATLEAAELAGLETKYPDGSEKPMLLSEPNAVIYDLYNEIKNGDISGSLLNFDKKQNVMVFDLGGGTLDITMHIVKPSNDGSSSMEIEEIATNRYTLLGGDDFDKILAENMYERYKNSFMNHPNVVEKISKEKNQLMPELLKYAETVKIEANNKFSGDTSAFSGWDVDDEEDNYVDAGGSMNNGYAYDDRFSKEEIEDIYSELMGNKFSFNDYKNIEKITDSNNIIYPILDVLAKAVKILGKENLKVDNVILNGGMSKFYMIKERIRDFFGFEPLTTTDPDLSVARGAAIYHYILLHRSDVKERMSAMKTTKVHNENPEDFIKKTIENKSKTVVKKDDYGLQFELRKVNESMYLGLKNGSVEEIIPAGSAIPYTSEQMKGFQIAPKQDRIAIPIKIKSINEEYITVANGNINIEKSYPESVYVSFILSMNENKIITMNAWISRDVECKNILETGSCSIDIEDFTKGNKKNKMISPIGNKLNAREEINHLVQMSNNHFRAPEYRKKEINEKIIMCIRGIYAAANKNDFADPILEALEKETNNTMLETRLFVAARKIGENWSHIEKIRLAKCCMSKLSGDLFGFSSRSYEKNRNTEIVRTLSICGEEYDIKKLAKVHNQSHYRSACIYTYAKTHYGINYLLQWFKEDINRVTKSFSDENLLQEIAYFIGIAYRKDAGSPINSPDEKTCIKLLLKAIKSKRLGRHSLISSMFAIGFICDQRFENNKLDKNLVGEAYELLNNVQHYYGFQLFTEASRSITLAKKMILGEELIEEEEKYLLEKVNK